MDRVSFFKNINGISYPEMLVDFFDHFIALKQLIDTNNCLISIIKLYDTTGIEFDVQFRSHDQLMRTLNDISKNGNVIIIYNKTMTIHVEIISDIDLKIKLY